MSSPTKAGKSTHIAVGLDRVTGEETWRVDLDIGPSANCFTLGDGTTVACATEIDSETNQNVITYLTAATGEQLMIQTVSTRPRIMALNKNSILTVGVDLPDRRIVLIARDATTFKEQWIATSVADTVPRTSTESAQITLADGELAVSVNGSSLVVDRTSGEIQTTMTDAVLTLAPGLVITRPVTDFSATGDARAATTIATSAGKTLLEVVGRAWTYVGAIKAPVPVIGIGGEAADATTGEGLWTVPGATNAVGLTGTVVGSEVVLSNRATHTPIKLVEAATGEAVWTSLAVSGTISIHDGTLFSATDETIVGIDLSTGKVLWTLEHGFEPTADTEVFQVVGATVVTAGDGTAVGYTFS